MQAAKNWCDGERVKKLGIWGSSKQGLGKLLLSIEYAVASLMQLQDLPVKLVHDQTYSIYY